MSSCSPTGTGFLRPECVWLNDCRVLLLGTAPEDPSVVIVYVCGEEQRLPASTRFKREPPARKQQKRSGVADSYDVEERLWGIADKLQRRCLARQAVLNGTAVPERYQGTRIATEEECLKMLARAEHRRSKQTTTPPMRPEREDVRRRRAGLEKRQRERAAMLLEHLARMEKRRGLHEQQEQGINLLIDNLLQQIWAGAGSR